MLLYFCLLIAALFLWVLPVPCARCVQNFQRRLAVSRSKVLFRFVSVSGPGFALLMVMSHMSHVCVT